MRGQGQPRWEGEGSGKPTPGYKKKRRTYPVWRGCNIERCAIIRDGGTTAISAGRETQVLGDTAKTTTCLRHTLS